MTTLGPKILEGALPIPSMRQDVASLDRTVTITEIGVRTESHVNEAVEAATDIVPFPKEAVEVDAFDR
jgi:hypothetical protein